MGIAVEQREGSTAICLEGTIDIASAAELKAAFLHAFKSSSVVQLSFTGDTDLDITAFQLLWAADREARVSGAGLVLAEQVPHGVLNALGDAGFEKFSFLT